MVKRLVLLVVAFLAAGPSQASAQLTADGEAVRRFAKGFMTYVPGSTFEVRTDFSGTSAYGPYQVFTIVRNAAGDKSPEQLGVLLDSRTRQIHAGLVYPLPPSDPPVTPDNLPRFVEVGLKDVLDKAFTAKVRVRWPGIPAMPTAIVPLMIDVGTGYGYSHMPMGLSADARYLVIGGSWSLDRDAREQRRDLIDAALVQWDPGHEDAIVKVVEFSDYECPACKRAWGEMRPAFESLGGKVRHGLVNFPLTNNHPWAFFAALGGSCIGAAWPDKLIAFKEDMYRQQDSLTAATVREAALGFLSQHTLDEAVFSSCFVKDATIDRVLQQMDLGHRVGVLGTPVYFANGEPLPYGRRELVIKRLEAIIAAGGKPERAAEVAWTPEPAKPTATPAPSPHAPRP